MTTDWKPSETADGLLDSWIGRVCNAIDHHENFCTFQFGEGQQFNAYCPWRIVIDGEIACSDEDHGQWFGRGSPMDVQAEANKHLLQQRIVAVDISKGTGDIAIVFENSIRLELFNNSAGYEAWVAFIRQGSIRHNVAAQGGGRIVVGSSE